MLKTYCKLRHIAISVRDVDRARKFFEGAFGMEKAGDARNGGIYMTDGVINVALLALGGKVPGIACEPFYGVAHFGLWVDDIARAEAQVRASGAVHVAGRAPATPNVHYEVKYRDPDGMIFDLTANGWRGAIKNLKSAD